MGNRETAIEKLKSRADNVSATDTRVVCEIDPAKPRAGHDETRRELLSCYLVSRPEAPRKPERFPLLAIDYSPTGNFEGTTRLGYGELQEFSGVQEYERQLDAAFNDTKIVDEIESMRGVCGDKKP